MKRRGFLGLAIGGALSGLLAKWLPQSNTTTWGEIAQSSQPNTISVPLPAHKEGDLLFVTFPAPVDGQTHWRLFAPTEPFGSLGPHYRLK
jgi:hypothetical protein